MRAAVDLSLFREFLAKGDVFLTPGLRLSRVMMQAIAEEQLKEGQPVLQPPTILPVDGWLEAVWREQVEAGNLPPRRLLGRVAERRLWMQVIQADLKKQADFSLIQPSSAAEQALRARQQWLMWGGDPEDKFQRQYFGFDADCATFERWCSSFARQLENNAWATRADIYRSLLTVPVQSKTSVVLCHVLQLPPLTRQALNHWAISQEPSVPERGSFSTLATQKFPSQRAESVAIAKWAAQRHRDNAGSTAIVLLDFNRDRPELEYQLRQEFDCLGARYAALPVNFSSGMPLSQTPMFRDALLALRLAAAGDTVSFLRSEVLALLRSPFLHGGADLNGTGLQQLRRACTELASERIDKRDLSHLAETFAPEAHLTRVFGLFRTDRSTREKRLPSLWLDAIRDVLRVWQWPGRAGLDSLEYQQFERLEVALDELAAQDAVSGEISFLQLILLWEQCLDDRVFQPKTDETAVQVFGPQEVVGLQFDALWICGLQSGRLPQRPQLLPFLPRRLQRELGLLDSDSVALEASAIALLDSLRATHGDVSASYASVQEGLEVLPSPLAHAIAPISPLSEEQVPSHWPGSLSLESLEEGNVPVGGANVQWGGGASVVSNQSNCPFRAWISHRLGPANVATPVFGLTPAERGNIVHDALRFIWETLKDSTSLRGLNEGEIEVLVSGSTERAVQALERREQRRYRNIRKRVGSACLDLEIERVTTLLESWLAVEVHRDGDFHVVEQEDSHELTLGALTLNLRPDRIDRLDDGREIVIDYKTGSVKRSSWLGERPSDAQLPLYALLNDSVEGVAFGRVHQEGVEYVFLGEALGLGGKELALEDQVKRYESEPVASWEALRATWRHRLEGLANDFVRGHAAIDPQPNACRYCALGSVCRYSQNAELPEETLLNLEEGAL